jgi:hypothetical protein
MEKNDDRTDKLKEWEMNMGERMEGDKGVKVMKGLEELRYINNSPFNFNGILL